MDILLDTNTIFLTIAIGHLLTAVLIRVIWRHHKRESTVHTFLLAKWLQGIAWCFLAVRGGIVDVFTISIFNTLSLLGDAMEIIAVLKLQKMFSTTLKRIYILLMAFNLIGFHLILVFYNVESARIAFASFAVAAMVVIPAYKILKQKNTTIYITMMGYFYLFIFVFFLLRSAAILLPSSSMSFFTPGMYQTISLLFLYLIMILGNIGYIFLFKEKADQELIRLASLDQLTKTLNRRTFIVRAKQCLTDYAKKREPISFLLFDVDHFKKINDTYGHNAGDLVLLDLTERINQHLGKDALFGRYGGGCLGWMRLNRWNARNRSKESLIKPLSMVYP